MKIIHWEKSAELLTHSAFSALALSLSGFPLMFIKVYA